MTDLYILNKRNEPVPMAESDLIRWGQWLDTALETGRRVVGRTEVKGYSVRTLFGGCDHNWDGGAPVLFETKVLKGGERRDLFTRRYTTWEEAVKGHEEVCRQLETSEEERL